MIGIEAMGDVRAGLRAEFYPRVARLEEHSASDTVLGKKKIGYGFDEMMYAAYTTKSVRGQSQILCNLLIGKLQVFRDVSQDFFLSRIRNAGLEIGVPMDRTNARSRTVGSF